MKSTFNWKSIIPHITAIIIFLVITFSYLSPLIEGKTIIQSDVMNYEGVAKEIKDYKKETGETALWTNSMFSGMPSYLINLPNSNKIKFFHRILNLNHAKPANYIFIYLIGFYIALLLFGVNPWLSIIGAIAYGFSSYFFIIVEAGHLTKAMALGYMPPIIAGFIYALRKNALIGSMVLAFFLSLQILVNHLQITYYTLLIILIYGIFHLVYVIKSNTYKELIKPAIYLLVAVVLAIGSNFANIYLTYDYGKDSMRGESELTHNQENKTSGLDKDYATAWSYGIDESLTLLIPNFKGGASGGSLTKNSATYELVEKTQGKGYARKFIKQLPLYWGSQPFTSGPVYVGAIVLFLFVLGLFVLKGKIKWWIVSATIFSIVLAWGNNFMFLTDLFLDYFPGYNKFRTVSMILVIAEFTIPLLAFLVLQKIIFEEIDKKTLIKYLKYSFYIVGGISLFFAVFSGIFNYHGSIDERYIAQGAQVFVDALQEDRQMLLRTDAIRSFIFILLAVSVLWAFIQEKLNKNTLLIVIGFLILIDMWSVNKRYLNNDDFTSKRKTENFFKPTNADKIILKDTDPHYRVYNLAVNTFNDASTSYFHKSIGGYHGAKMRRYQELIDFHISKNNMNVLNMLNTKYFIIPDKQNQIQVQINMQALGNIWFVEEYKIVKDADEEINELTDFNPAKTAIVDARFRNYLEDLNLQKDANISDSLISYSPNQIKYKYKAQSEQLAVFSEIYYDKGWNAYIDGEKVPHIRVNYVLRALRVPAGEHQIEFKFEPKAFYVGNIISVISSLILILGFIGVMVFYLFFNKKEKVMA